MKSQGEVEVFMNYAKGYHRGSQILLLLLALRCVGQVSKTRPSDSYLLSLHYLIWLLQ